MKCKGVCFQPYLLQCQVCRRRSWLRSGVAMPTAGTAGLSLENTMRLCLRWAIIKFRQKKRAQNERKKVIRQVYPQFEFDLRSRHPYCQLTCVVYFPPVRTSRHRVFQVGSSVFLFDVVDIKGKISPALYKTLIPFSICPSISLIHILQRQVGM